MKNRLFAMIVALCMAFWMAQSMFLQKNSDDQQLQAYGWVRQCKHLL